MPFRLKLRSQCCRGEPFPTEMILYRGRQTLTAGIVRPCKCDSLASGPFSMFHSRPKGWFDMAISIPVRECRRKSPLSSQVRKKCSWWSKFRFNRCKLVSCHIWGMSWHVSGNRGALFLCWPCETHFDQVPCMLFKDFSRFRVQVQTKGLTRRIAQNSACYHFIHSKAISLSALRFNALHEGER